MYRNLTGKLSPKLRFKAIRMYPSTCYSIRSMKNKCSFYLPATLRDQLKRLYYPELQEMAKQAGNESVYRALDEEAEDLGQIAARIGAEAEFAEYRQLLDCYRSKKMIPELSELTGDFYRFLLAKICFPDAFY